jgi:predicted transposase/invertase (TIGR01784 family)
MAKTRRTDDSAWKYLFSSTDVVHQLLTQFVDDDVISRVALEDIEPFDKSFVSDAFLDRESDVIYRINMPDRMVYLYVLIEFQSTVDKSIPIRMLHYITGLYDQMFRTSTAGALPAVFPILLYNGRKRWTVPRNVRELIEPTVAKRYIPSFEYYAIIEREIPDEVLERIRGILSAVMYLDKRRNATELRNAVDHVIGMLEKERPEQLRMFRVWLNRMFHMAVTGEQRYRIDELMEVKSMLSEVVDQIKNKGRQEGLREGRRAAALHMLRKGYPLNDVMEVTELPRNEIARLAEAVTTEENKEQGGLSSI